MKTGCTLPLGALLVLLTACGAPAQPVTAQTANAQHAQASAAAPHWSMPTCPLRYELRSLETTKMMGVGEGVQLATFIDIRAVPRDSFLELTTAVTAEPSMGSRYRYASEVTRPMTRTGLGPGARTRRTRTSCTTTTSPSWASWPARHR